MTSRLYAALATSVIVSASLTPGASVHAQQVLEEITVTAQKREESAQEVPITITAFSGDGLEDKNILAIEDLARYTPGLNVAQSDPARTRVRIRGIGSRKFDVGSEGSVGIFIDEIYMPRFSGVDFSLLDLERLEVLKGPQGTLFGRNTTGGAISIVSRAPTQEFGGWVEAGVGNESSFLARGSVSGAVSDNVSVRLSAGGENLGGFSTNSNTGTSNDKESRAARLQVLIEPTDDLSVAASVQYTSVKSDALIAESEAILPGGLAVPLLTPPGTTTVVTPDRYSEPFNFDGSLDSDALLSILRIEKNFDNVDFVSLTGFRDSSLDMSEDFDRTNLDVGVTDIDEESDTLSQEFRLSSDNWIFGLYYYKDDAYRADNFGWNSGSLPFLLAGGTSLVGSTIVDVETTSWAAFGQYSFALSDRTDLTIGFRYSDDEKDFVLSGETTFPGVPNVPAPFAYADTASWDSFDPKISLNFQASDSVLLFASYSQGYKSGGVQFSAGLEAVARQIFDPEELDAYEIGVKSDLLDNTMRLNASAFLYDYDNLQQQRVELFGPAAVAVTRNAGASEIKGLELDTQWLPTDALSLRLAYSFLDAEFTEFIGTGGASFAGNPVPNTPNHTVTVSAEYSTVSAGGWEAVFGTNWFWSDEFNFDVTDDDPFTKHDSYSVGAVHISFISPNGAWEIRAYAENVADEDFDYSIVRRGPEVLTTPSEKRRYGIRVRRGF